MNITLNGKKQTIDKNITVGNLISQLNLNKYALVVEVNKEILEKEKVKEHVLNEGDVVELISFFGGG